ncbi:MAG: ABC transporter ATP-binding protein [Deltaproteobacteria bacterium]|nr:ABC transporter ATP-binding protein [Deltaproteobacteria bacterium]
MAEDKPAIELDRVSFSFNGRNVLENVSLTVNQRDFLAVIGPNGGGKTTLIKVMAGLLKPQQGTVRVRGEKPADAARHIGYMPQDLHLEKDFPITVMDVALMGRMTHHRLFHGRYTREDKKAAAEALERLEILDLADQRVGRLSGGQRQRLFIARALAGDPKILLLDEPTSSVDPEGQTRLYRLLKELNETMTIVVVSHDLMVLSSYVTSVACVARHVHHHDSAEITEGMLEDAYHCPVEIIAHGVPHRVFRTHTYEKEPE